MVHRLLDSWSNWNLEILVFEERRKPEYSEKNLSERGREPTTNFISTIDVNCTGIERKRDNHNFPWSARV